MKLLLKPRCIRPFTQVEVATLHVVVVTTVAVIVVEETTQLKEEAFLSKSVKGLVAVLLHLVPTIALLAKSVTSLVMLRTGATNASIFLIKLKNYTMLLLLCVHQIKPSLQDKSGMLTQVLLLI